MNRLLLLPFLVLTVCAQSKWQPPPTASLPGLIATNPAAAATRP